MTWPVRFETDYGLGWDPERQVWTASDIFPFGDKRTHDAA